MLCLGLGELTAEEIVEQCHKYDTQESWTYGLSKEYLLEHAQDWYKNNEMLKKECTKYNIKYNSTNNDCKYYCISHNKLLFPLIKSIKLFSSNEILLYITTFSLFLNQVYWRFAKCLVSFAI